MKERYVISAWARGENMLAVPGDERAMHSGGQDVRAPFRSAFIRGRVFP
ncbi:MAG: hypothetical protein QOF72_2507 [Blastocatellia bacterium]|nr:hypothetical protein [Blastocatellia bacterium]